MVSSSKHHHWRNPGYLLSALGGTFFAFGALIMKISLGLNMFSVSPIIIFSFICYLIGFFFIQKALYQIEVSISTCIVTGSLIVISVLLSFFLLEEILTYTNALGVIMILIGLIVIGVNDEVFNSNTNHKRR